MKIKTIIKLLGLSLFIMIGFSFVTQSKDVATASPAPTCGVLAPMEPAPSNCYVAAVGDATPGQDYNTCTVVNPSVATDPSGLNNDSNCSAFNNLTQTERKDVFEENILAYAASADNNQKAGGKWIEKLWQANGNTNWEQAINNPDVTLIVESYSYQDNTDFIPSSPGVTGHVNGPYSDPGSSLSLVFDYKGNEVFAIKLDCGNPVGSVNIQHIPSYSVTISGYIYGYNTTTHKHVNLASVPINTCVTGLSATTGSNGSYTFSISSGTKFCISVPSTVTDQVNNLTYKTPLITPDYILPATIPTGLSGSCSAVAGTPVTYEYEGLEAGNLNNRNTCDYGLDDTGYYIALQYTPPPTPHPTPTTYQCGATTAPTDFIVGNTYNISAYVTGTASPSSGSVFDISITGPTTKSSSGYTVSGPTNGTYTVSGIPISLDVTSPGTYVIDWSFQPAGSLTVVSCTHSVGYGPTLNVYGGDIMAGSDFLSTNSTCNVSSYSSSSIFANGAINSNGTYVGSGTDEGAFASSLIMANQIAGFASQNASPNSHNPPDGLSFGNSTEDGGFGAAYCVPDFYAELSNQSGVLTADSNSTNDQLSDFVLPANTTLGSGNRYIIVTTKDFYINENVTYNTIPGSTAITDLPYLYVVDDGGNIYIDNSVTHLAGVFIDEPTASSITNASTSGNIFDCNSTGAAGPDLHPFSDCISPLTIDGSFIAANIDFQRTNATSAVTPDCNSGAHVYAADVFCYTPLTWLANPFSATTSLTTNYISAVPPTL